ncbi:MAG: holo-ACP synthase [Myxococcales bacterium]|nr:holo-ACP synthase [Myxococcales bacterium]
MAVRGLGLDVCAVDRMTAALARHGERFERRIFTEAERAYAAGRANQAEALAARFAVKEATSKALGAPRGIDWHDVEVTPARSGLHGPGVVLRGRAREVAAERGIVRVMISITHAGGVAAAVAIAVDE